MSKRKDSRSCSVLFVPGNAKSTSFRTEKWRICTDKLRKLPALRRVNAAIGKSTILFTMSMQIQTHLYLIFFRKLCQLLFYVKYLRVNELKRALPSPVQVITSQIASKIAVNHPVNINHRKYMKIEAFHQPFAVVSLLLDQLFQNVLNKKRRPSFS